MAPNTLLQFISQPGTGVSLPEPPGPRLASVLIPGPVPVARGMEQTDGLCLLMFPPIEPGGLCPSGGERDSPESWEGGPPTALVHLSFPSVGADLLLFYHWTLCHLGLRLNFTSSRRRH